MKLGLRLKRLIQTGERSGLQMRIAATESGYVPHAARPKLQALRGKETRLPSLFVDKVPSTSTGGYQHC
jgi:hypothetical protein